MARTAEPEGWTSQFREIILDVALQAHDLRADPARFGKARTPNSYVESQALAGDLRAAGSDGIAYPSSRQSGGECVALFYPDLAANPIQGRHLDYHWTGARVGLYREPGSGGDVPHRGRRMSDALRPVLRESALNHASERRVARPNSCRVVAVAAGQASLGRRRLSDAVFSLTGVGAPDKA